MEMKNISSTLMHHPHLPMGTLSKLDMGMTRTETCTWRHPRWAPRAERTLVTTPARMLPGDASMAHDLDVGVPGGAAD